MTNRGRRIYSTSCDRSIANPMEFGQSTLSQKLKVLLYS
jgi:hypothetical protein